MLKLLTKTDKPTIILLLLHVVAYQLYIAVCETIYLKYCINCTYLYYFWLCKYFPHIIDSQI